MARISKIQEEMNTKFEPLKVESEDIKRLEKEVSLLLTRVEDLENKINKKIIKGSSINKVEAFNGEADLEPREEAGFRLTSADKIVSAKNAAKILPPNLIVEGRHTKENISAICGFQVDDDMMDEIYLDLVHEPY